MVKKALLIGVNYIGTEDELNGCINDVNNINKFLVNNCEYQIDNIKILTEKSEILPTKENIVKNIEWLVSNNSKNDILFFYYSGHGTNTKDKNKDESDKKDEEIVPLDGDDKGYISDDWLYKNLVASVPKDINMWCFFDACHSGTMLDLVYNYRSECKYTGKNKLNKNTLYNQYEWTTKFSFSQEKSNNVLGNICEFSGCLDSETSDDSFIKNQNNYQGAFTYCFLKFLNNNLNKDKKFTGKNIKLKDVLKEINALLKIYDYKQNSQLSVGNIADIERFFEI
jgi:hypothetical protein